LLSPRHIPRLLAAGLLLLPVGGGTGAAPVSIDRVKIVVNDKTLTAREVEEIRQFQVNQLKSRFKGSELESQLGDMDRELTDRMVEDLLLESYAERRKIEISDKTIEERVESILQREPALGQTYTEEQIKSYVLKELLRRQVLGQEVDAKVRVSDEEVKAACRRKGQSNREVEVGHILIREGEPDAERKIGEIRGKLLQGADFEETALANSQDPSVSTNRGRLGFIARGQFVKPFEDAAFSLAVGALSEPVPTRFGLHLIKVFSERERERLNCEKLGEVDRQSFYNQIYNDHRRQELERFLALLRKKSDIRVLP
jgi:parvulin-like peptidyl-prolyl isomerase